STTTLCGPWSGVFGPTIRGPVTFAVTVVSPAPGLSTVTAVVTVYGLYVVLSVPASVPRPAYGVFRAISRRRSASATAYVVTRPWKTPRWAGGKASASPTRAMARISMETITSIRVTPRSRLPFSGMAGSLCAVGSAGADVAGPGDADLPVGRAGSGHGDGSRLVCGAQRSKRDGRGRHAGRDP